MNKEQRLVPPCVYQGGKQRLAKTIVDIIYIKILTLMKIQSFMICVVAVEQYQ